MNEMMLVLVLYGDGPRRATWWDDFVTFVAKLSDRYQWNYTHIELVSSAGTSPPQSRSYKYSRGAVVRLGRKFQPGRTEAAGATWAGEDGDLNVGAHAVVGFSTAGPRHPYSQLTVVAEPQSVFRNGAASPESQCIEVMEDAGRLMANRYGLVHLMSRSKAPGFYFTDLYNDRLTPDERSELDRWRRASARYTTLIRNIYWGNVVSEGHGGSRMEELLKELERCVGKQHMVPLSGSRNFFSVPFDIRDSALYDKELVRWREQLRDALAPFEVLM